MNAVFVATIRNGKIVESHHYFDLLTILTQLGIAPMMGAGARSPVKGDGQPRSAVRNSCRSATMRR